MPQGRMILKKISHNPEVNSLPAEAALLFTWLVTHLDGEGRINGNPRWVNSTVFPLRDYSEPQVEAWLQLMAEARDHEGIGLLIRYKVNSVPFIYVPGFERSQTNRKKGYEGDGRHGKSDIPEPPSAALKGKGTNAVAAKPTPAPSRREMTKDRRATPAAVPEAPATPAEPVNHPIVDYWKTSLPNKRLTSSTLHTLLGYVEEYGQAKVEAAIDTVAFKGDIKVPIKWMETVLANADSNDDEPAATEGGELGGFKGVE